MRKLILILLLMVNLLYVAGNQCGAYTYEGTGTWSYLLTNYWTSAGCYWNRNLSGTVAVTQTGDNVQIVDHYNGAIYTGTVSGTSFSVSGSYPDEGGSQVITINFTLSSNASDSGSLTSHLTIAPYCNAEADISITKICNYSISPASKSFTLVGGTDSVGVSTTGSDCSWAADWTATSNTPWITITSGSSGNGSVNYSVLPYSGTGQRAGTMTIAGQTFTVTQITKSDVIINFGPGIGLLVRMNNSSTWTWLHSLSPEIVTTGDMDGN